ncbi:hypothetical protein GCM10009133_12740 [Cocleimonas flava]|uniref:TetR family transcriptional regulator n=1 Tax=Cocleimonas flava TaxID=634765 RepID=A0A4R1F517_9GAMM|nr:MULTISPECIES: TetR/AcrR family transcriptional regulator [Cocleimonas]MEB8432894.1 TetR/AcrR family transcriptional regulator [Cocleimonas sp. KMM 6892]MEC4716125.1 TetR/AcrR family transcriptional regulator [Cocleimonas sp. KMM 6895]MEC4745586.1 TetR/AcrR family transcriptional regulator [Cocleimonas sp. KMM 6896]TCJ87639.1 TetR family transcriptional regulator [Cocleimonas flava]
MPYLKREAPNPEPIDCRILTAALDLFVNSGYHNVSVHEIQKQADVSIGSIYKHFGGKDGIAKALYKHILNEMDELVDDVMNEHKSPKKQCEEIIRLLCGYTETHYDIMAFIFHAKHTEFVPDEPLICNTLPFIKIREIVKSGMECGEFREINSWVAASTIFGGVIRMIQLRLDNMIEEPLPTYFETLIDASLNGVLTSDTTKTDNKISAVL